MLHGVQGQAKNSGAVKEKKKKNKESQKPWKEFFFTFPSSKSVPPETRSVAATLPGRLPLQSVLRPNACLKRLWLA